MCKLLFKNKLITRFLNEPSLEAEYEMRRRGGVSRAAPPSPPPPLSVQMADEGFPLNAAEKGAQSWLGLEVLHPVL